MPVVPIPSDWDGKTWSCVQIYWPDSVKWFAILAGLVLTPSRGRFWDERTGSIIDTQAIGREIDAKNMPFITCEGAQIAIDSETLTAFIGGLESEEIMSLCGYNPKAFRIQDGSLWVRDFCGEWVEIGALSATPDIVDTEDTTTEPPEQLADSTPCAIASKLAVTVYNIVVSAFNNLTSGGLEAWVDIPDWLDDVGADFPGIDLSFNDMVDMWFNMIPLQAAGLQSETESLKAIDYLKCYWVDLIESTNSGVDSDTYEELKDAATGALKAAFGDSAYSGFGQAMRVVWQDAFKAIGPKDIQKLTYYVQPTGLENCDCPITVDPSSIFFTGAFTFGGDPETTATLLAVQYNGRRAHMQLEAAEFEEFPSITDFDLVLYGAGSGDYITVRIYPDTAHSGGFMPIATWETYTTPAPSDEWFECSVQGGNPCTREDFATYVEFTSDDDNPASAPQWVRLEDLRMYPSGGTGGPFSWRFYVEIVAVNGVRLTPIGP